MEEATKFDVERASHQSHCTGILWTSVGCVIGVFTLLWTHVVMAAMTQYTPTHHASLLFGWLALTYALLNLGCLVRPRSIHIDTQHRLHILRDPHMLSGLLATLFVALHAVLQPRTWIASLSATLLALSLLAGLLTHLLAALSHTSELPINARIAELESLIPGVREPLYAALHKPSPSQPPGTGVCQLVRSIPNLCRIAHARRVWVLTVFRCRAAHTYSHKRTRAQHIADEVADLAARDVYEVLTRSLFSVQPHWRHRCALLLLGGILLHCIVTLLSD